MLRWFYQYLRNRGEATVAIKEKRITCKACGERATVIRGERGPVSPYCDTCREQIKRDQARERVAAMRARNR